MGDTRGPQFDLFISYADAERAWVEGYLLDALTAANITFHHEALFTLGAPRVLEFERAVEQSRRVLLVLSPAYLADNVTQFTDLLAQSYGRETATWPVIPLIRQLVDLPPRLAMLTALDATDPEDWEHAIETLLRNLQQPLPPPPEKPPCPYPGMKPFGTDDARNFFGREAEIDRMLQRLRHQRFLLVVGDSGSGKSSLITAGFLPRLRESTSFPPGYWLDRTMRPGSQPLQALAQEVGVADPAQPAAAIAGLLAAHPPAQRLLLIIDPFEEVFTQASRPDQTRFIAVLKDLREIESCALVLALRGDFYYSDLAGTQFWPVAESERQDVAPLRGEALRDAIEKPAARQGVYLEPTLLELLLADAAGQPGPLPLVQETMRQLWDRMARRFIPLAAYQRLSSGERSGLAGALVTKADATLQELARRSPRHEAIARRIFVRLVQFGEGRPDTRRQQPESALRSWDDGPRAFDETLQHLAENRLLTLSGEEDQDRQVDIAHEALFTEWPALKESVRGWRGLEQARRRLEEWATNWIDRERDPKALLNPVELSQAEEWLQSKAAGELGCSAGLRELAAASAAALRRARLLRVGAWGTIAGLIIVALLIALWFSQRIARQTEAFGKQQATLAAEARAGRDEAVRAKEAVDTERQRADGLASDLHLRQLLLKSESLVADRYDQALLLSIAAYRLADTAETRSNLLRTLRTSPQVVRYIPSSDASAIAFSPDSGALVALAQDGIRLLDASTGDALAPAATLIDGTTVWSRDGKMGYAAEGGDIRLWDMASRQAQGLLTGHQTSDWGWALSPDGRFEVQWLGGDTFSLEDKLTGHLDNFTAYRFDEGPGVVFSPDSRAFAADCVFNDDGPVTIIMAWELEVEEYSEGEEGLSEYAAREVGYWYFTGDEQSEKTIVGDMIFSPDSQYLAVTIQESTDVVNLLAVKGSGDGDDQVLWQNETNDVTAPTLTSLSGVCQGYLAAGRSDGKIIFQAVDKKVEAARPPLIHPGPVQALAFSPDCRRLASLGNGVIVLWDLQATAAPPLFKLLETRTPAPRAPTIAWDFSGALPGSKCTRTRTQVDPMSNCVQSAIDGGYAGFTGIVTSLARSPDGIALAAGVCSEYDDGGSGDCYTGEVWMWPGGPDQGINLGPVEYMAVTELIFSPDGKALAAVDQDGTIRIWDVAVASLVADACYKAGRNLTDAEWADLTGYDPPGQPACPSMERPGPARGVATLKQFEPFLPTPRPTITLAPTRTPRPTRTPWFTATPAPTATPQNP